MIVADTNLIGYFFIKGDFTDTAKAVFKKDAAWIAPLLWRSEFRNVLSLYMRKRFLSLPQALDLMGEAEFLMSGMEYSVPSSTVLGLAENSRCSAYDCEFVALAQELDVILVTSDSLILKEFPSISVHISKYVI